MIDAFTLIAWRALGTPRFFYRWWARESPAYRAISLLGARRPLGPPHREHGEADPERAVHVPGTSGARAGIGSPGDSRAPPRTRSAAVLVPAASAQAAPLTTPCGGRAITPDKVITGEFGTDLNKTLRDGPVRRPARAPPPSASSTAGTRPSPAPSRHTLDLGLYEPRRRATAALGRARVPRLGRLEPPRRDRSRAEGFSSEADYRANPTHRGARQDDARLPAGADPAGRVGGRAGRRRPSSRSPTATPTARSAGAWRSSSPTTRRSRTSRTGPPRYDSTPGAHASRAGTRATSTCTPSTRPTATRP